jgi:hypothetical protein
MVMFDAKTGRKRTLRVKSRTFFLLFKFPGRASICHKVTVYSAPFRI